MAAPAGLCEECGNQLQWRFDDLGALWTSCSVCIELELGDYGPKLAVGESCDEAVRRDEDLPF